jgi:hypothetical protein
LYGIVLLLGQSSSVQFCHRWERYKVSMRLMKNWSKTITVSNLSSCQDVRPLDGEVFNSAPFGLNDS